MNTRVTTASCAVVLFLASAIAAQQPPPVSPVEQLTFDRPEAWALKYFISTTTLSGLDAPAEKGSISVGLEGGWIPRLSDSQQRVGFNGTTPQDLNKAPMFVRPRVSITLPGRITLIAAGVPPIKMFEVTPRLFAAAVEWAISDRGPWRVAIRGHGQTGSVTGAFTCPATVLIFTPGSLGNPAGCTSESADGATLRYAGAELHVGRRIAGLHGLIPHVAAGANFVDSAYQMNATAFGAPDRTRMEASGITPSASAGFAYELNHRFAVVADAFYSPLTVRRPPGASRTVDSLLTARMLIEYRLRR